MRRAVVDIVVYLGALYMWSSARLVPEDNAGKFVGVPSVRLSQMSAG